MKSILMITALLMGVLAFEQENRSPGHNARSQSFEHSQSSSNSQGKAIVNLSDVLANRGVRPLDWTEHALKDKKGLCKVHHVALSKATVPILYGLTPGPPYSKETEERLFPNAITGFEGGCIIMHAKEALVLQCQKCIKAKTKWANK